MASPAVDTRTTADREWFILGRWQEYEGEGRANLLRAIALTAFYFVELINYQGLSLGFLQMPQVTDRATHLSITLLVLAWAMLCIGVLICRKQGIFPFWLKFVSTGCDLVLLTAVLALTNGPKSPLIVAYFLVVALASLRFSLRLIWFATGGAVAGYLFLLGFARSVAPELGRPDQTVPRYFQLVFLLALVLTGIVLGQVIRRIRKLAEQYARRIDASGERPGRGGTT